MTVYCEECDKYLGEVVIAMKGEMAHPFFLCQKCIDEWDSEVTFEEDFESKWLTAKANEQREAKTG